MKHTNQLFDKNTASNLIRNQWPAAAEAAYRTNLSLTVLSSNTTEIFHNSTLVNALMTVPAKSKQIVETPLAEITMSNERVWYLIGNAATTIESNMQLVLNEMKKNAESAIHELSVLYVVAAIMPITSMVLLCLFALRPAVFSVLQDKDRAFLTFFDVSVSNTIKENLFCSLTDISLQISDVEKFLVPIFERVNLLTAEAGDPGTDRGAAVMEDAADFLRKTEGNTTSVAIGKDSKTPEKVQESKVKAMRKRQRAKQRFSNNSRERTKRLLFYMMRLAVIVVLYIAYFSTHAVFSQSQVKSRQGVIHKSLDSQRQAFLTRKVFFSLRELQMNRIESLLGNAGNIVNNINSTDVQKALEDLDEAREFVLFGNKVSS